MDGATVVVVGGGGGVGSVAARALAQTDDADAVVVADLDPSAAGAVVSEIGDSRFRAAGVDIGDPDALGEMIRDAAVVLNCAGPFYRFGPPTLEASIRAGVDYVDICDDLDATRTLLALGAEAESAGTTALVGMGNSPGLANLFVKLCAELFFDEIHSAEIIHIHGGEPDEGAGVLKHRIHAMTNDVPVFVDGEMHSVRMLEESGAPFIRTVDFPDVGSSKVFPYPHPETITLPVAFPTLRRATNLGVVFPFPYFELTQDLVRAGMASEESVPVGDTRVAPIDMMVSVLRSRRPAMLADAGITGPAGCLMVVVSGLINGEAHRYEISLSSGSAGAGEGTGIPAALGAILMLRGALECGPGVHPPEVAVPVAELLELAPMVASGVGVSGDGLPLTVRHFGPSGECEEIPFSLGGPQ